jgi:hypothetical protein
MLLGGQSTAFAVIIHLNNKKFIQKQQNLLQNSQKALLGPSSMKVQ